LNQKRQARKRLRGTSERRPRLLARQPVDEFTLRKETLVARRGNYLVAAASMRRGYATRSSSPVEMLFEFAPGGMEALFYEIPYR
jgi:hypothetical protein